MSNPIPINSFTPAIHLIFSEPHCQVPDEQTLSRKINAVSPEYSANEVRVHWSENDAAHCRGEVRFGKHRIQVAGQAVPLPPAVLDRTVHVSPWQPQIKASMRQHRSHLSLVYSGAHPDPIERMLALYTLSFAFNNENLLGLVNEQAWTAHPPADFLTIERIHSYRDELPFILWVGYVKFYVDQQHYWLATKGHHIFDVPDLAAFIESGDQEGEIIERLIKIFYYLYEKDVEVTAGDTLEIQPTGLKLVFGEVREYPELLLGPSGTLTVESFTNSGDAPGI